MERGAQPPPGNREEVVHEREEVVPTEVEERVEKLGTWSYAGAGLAVLAAILAIVALVVALGDGDGNGEREGADPRELQQVRDEVRELSGGLDEVRDQAAAGAETDGRIDDLSDSVSDVQSSVDAATGSVDELSNRLDGLEQELSDLRSEVEAQGDRPPGE